MYQSKMSCKCSVSQIKNYLLEHFYIDFTSDNASTPLNTLIVGIKSPCSSEEIVLS